MGIYNNKYRTPVQLTGTVRGAFDAHMEKYAVSSLFPVKANQTLDYEFKVGSTLLPPAARFRSFNTESDVNVSYGAQAAKGKLPPMSIRQHIDEYTQLLLMGGGGIGNKMDEYSMNHGVAMASRFIIAATDALVDSKVVISDRGLTAEIDFNRRPELTATAVTPWSDAAADPINDLNALATVFGLRVDEMWISRQTMLNLQRNAKIIELYTNGATAPSVISPAAVESVLALWGFPPRVVDEKIVDQFGVDRPLIAANKVVFISGDTLGSTQLGVTAEAINPDYGISEAEQPGLFSGAAPQNDPEGYNVYASAIGLPVADLTNNTAVLTV